MVKKIDLKTKQTNEDVTRFLATIDDEQKRTDCLAINELLQEVTGEPPKMWGKSIVGYGSYTYTNTMGSNEWFVVGFSPRKANITLYIMAGFPQFDELMKQLGKYSTGKSCLYIKKLADVDQQILRRLVKASIDYLTKGGQPHY